ncbi:MAG: MutS-related protein [Terriglobales bacterium]
MSAPVETASPRPPPPVTAPDAGSTAAGDGAAEYRTRLSRQQARAALAARRDTQLGLAKLAGVGALVLVAWLAFISHLIAGWWVWLPVAALVALFLAHDGVIRGRKRAERLEAFYERGLARLEDRWAGGGSSGARFRDPAHPYADDLDLFGPGSLFELLSTARTTIGEERLAAWMRVPAPPQEVRARQRRLLALREQLDLREQIAALGEELSQSLDPAQLRAWAAAPARLQSAAARAACWAVAVAGLGLLVYGFGSGQFTPLFLLIVAEALVYFQLRQRLAPALGGRGAQGEGLRLFAGVLERIPDAPPALRDGPRALRQLARLADWIEASESMLGKVLDITVLYSVHLAYAADGWRARYGAEAAGWLEAVGEFEALLSLATFAYEHPADPFPELLEAAPPSFEGEELGHPLLPAATCVRNPVGLDDATRLLLVSGSNMSGKSTLMRTVGLNAVLAQMGAPVRARALRLTPLALGTRLRTSDSLQLGRSGFYAEILRLRQVYDLTAGSLPVLYLFDELLEGTNSHDRVLGGRGLLQALLARPTLGIVTTHDLALTAIAADLAGVRNVHFEDQIEGNDVRFDHRLRDGIVTKSNALALMRIIGLDV